MGLTLGNMKHLPYVNINTINHNSQRYDTAGDFEQITPLFWAVRISKLPMGWRAEACLMIHELVEMILTRHNKIPWGAIDKFDMDNQDIEDPGLCPKSPYHNEHMAATQFEKMLCQLLGIKWEEYDADFRKLRYNNRSNRRVK
jgi:hypothetical protein